MMERFTVFKVGTDVAGPGEDETVLVVQVGGVIIAQHAWYFRLVYGGPGGTPWNE
jgi:hypothetical protein